MWTCAVEFGVRAGALADVAAKHDPEVTSLCLGRDQRPQHGPVSVRDLDGHPVAGRDRRASARARGAVLLGVAGRSELRFDHDMVELVCEVVGVALDDRGGEPVDDRACCVPQRVDRVVGCLGEPVVGAEQRWATSPSRQFGDVDGDNREDHRSDRGVGPGGWT